MNPSEEKQNDPFIQRLLKLEGDPGSLSHLRRFWSPATIHYAYPILGRLGVPDPNRADAITAALFAIHPKHRLGGSGIGKAALFLGERKENHHPYDSHFRRLLASDALEEVGRQLFKLMRRLEREGITVDFNQVMWDLRNWNKKAAEVKTRWAMDYWNATPQESEI